MVFTLSIKIMQNQIHSYDSPHSTNYYGFISNNSGCQEMLRLSGNNNNLTTSSTAYVIFYGTKFNTGNKGKQKLHL
jgi:hypothetical protein